MEAIQLEDSWKVASVLTCAPSIFQRAWPSARVLSLHCTTFTRRFNSNGEGDSAQKSASVGKSRRESASVPGPRARPASRRCRSGSSHLRGRRTWPFTGMIRATSLDVSPYLVHGQRHGRSLGASGNNGIRQPTRASCPPPSSEVTKTHNLL